MSSNILAFSNYDNNFVDIHNITYPHNKKYFEKHDIEYQVFNKQYLQVLTTETYHITKSYYVKWFLLDYLLQTRYDVDYFFAIDTDIIMCDFDIDLRIFTKLSNKDILLCSVEDCASNMFWNVNAGSIIFKNSENTRNFVRRYLNQAKVTDYNIVDQSVLQHILAERNDIRSMVAIFPSCCFNHGGVDSFMYHDCSLSTSSTSLEECVKSKSRNLSRAIATLQERGVV